MVNLEAEYAVVGSLLLGDADEIEDVLLILQPEDFYDVKCRMAYFGIVKQYEEGPIDALTVWEHIKHTEVFKTVEDLVKLTDFAGPNLIHYAKIVKENSIIRQLSKLGSELVDYSKTKPASELLDYAEYKIMSLSEQKTFKTFKPLGDFLPNVFEHLETLTEKVRLGINVIGIPSGFNELDNMTGGFRNGDLVIVAARPSMGKTAFALNIGLNAAKQDYPVIFFSLEMGYQQLIERLLSFVSLVDLKKIRHGSMSDDEYNRVVLAASKLQKLPFIIDDESILDLRAMRAKLRRAKRDYGVKLAFVDYLQLMSAKRAESRQQEIAEISRGLKLLARELDITIVALSQLSRAVEQREDKRPRLSDLRESGAIEQDADVVMFLYKDSYYNPPQNAELKAEEVEIIIGKQRNGPTGSVMLLFSKNTTGFFSVSLLKETAG